MAKEKEEKPSKDKDVPYRINASQLIEEFSSRPRLKLCMSLDVATGGGIPRGCTIVVSGTTGLGKTTTALQFAANAHQAYPDIDVYFFPIEGRLTDTLFQQVQGLDHKRLYIIRPPIVSGSDGQKIGHKLWSSKDWLDVMGECVTDNPGCVMIIDSVSSLVSEKERSEGVGVQDRGASKILESQFCRIYGTSVVSQGITLIVLAQTIANPTGYGLSTMPKVGSGFKFMSDLTLVARGIDKWKPEGVSDDYDGEVLGHDIKFKVEKNSLGAPFGTVVIPLRYGYGIDTIKDVMINAIDWGLIIKKTAWYYLPFAEVTKKAKKADKGEETLDIIPVGITENPTKGEEKVLADPSDGKVVKCQGEANAWEWLSSHPREFKNLEERVRNMIFTKETV